MAATFLKAQNYEIGRSLFEADRLDTTIKLLRKANESGVQLLLPTDVLVADSINAPSGQIVPVENILADKMIVDIGPQTIRRFTEVLQKSKTVFWNGPMGIYEYTQFAGGTRTLAELLAGLPARTIIGGGSTADIIADLKLSDKMTFVSTGGGFDELCQRRKATRRRGAAGQERLIREACQRGI